MKKVLIVSYYFPPKNIIASKRYGLMCKYMRENGYEPYILTIHTQGDLEVPIPEKNIFRIGKAQNNSTFLSKEIKLNFNQMLICSIIEDSKLIFRTIDKVSITWFNELRENFNKLKDKLSDIDIIVGTYGPIGNILCARYLSKKLNIPWIAELRDLISQYEEDIPKGYKKSKLLDFLYEYYLLSTASGIVTVTKGFKKILKPIYNKNMKVVYNGWDNVYNVLEEFEVCDEMKGSYLYYAGLLYEHRLASIYIFLKTFSKLEDKELKFIIRSLGPKSCDVKVKKYIKKLNLEDRVFIKEVCSDAQVKQEQEKALINIVLSDISESKPYLLSTIPGKVMELINVKPPILAIANPKSEISDILSDTKKGVVVDDEKNILEFITKGYKNYLGDYSKINKYSRKYQAKRLCEFLDKFC